MGESSVPGAALGGDQERASRPRYFGCGRGAIALLVVALVVVVAIVVVALRQGPGPTFVALAKSALVALGVALTAIGWLLRHGEGDDPVSAARLYGPYLTAAEALGGAPRPNVVLTGVAQPDQPELPTAPLSRQRCLYFRLVIGRLVVVGPWPGEPEDALGTYEPVAETSRDVTFLLTDETGQIRVDPTAATIDGTITEELDLEPGRHPAGLAELRRKLKAAGFPARLPATDELGRPIYSYIVSEEVILPGDRLTVIGPIVSRDGAPLIAADAPGALLNIAVDDAEAPLTQLRAAARRVRLVGRLLTVAGLAVLALGIALLLGLV